MTTKTNATKTTEFLAVVDLATKNDILDNVAKHYGITREQAYAEITDDDAEHILDYVTGPMRAGASLLMKRHGLA